ncbi:hypothetical protein SRHO_G00334810 [Serrasalmus rhombeus]
MTATAHFSKTSRKLGTESSPSGILEKKDAATLNSPLPTPPPRSTDSSFKDRAGKSWQAVNTEQRWRGRRRLKKEITQGYRRSRIGSP